MKTLPKYHFILTAFCLSLLFTACEEKADPAPAPEPEHPEQPVPTPMNEAEYNGDRFPVKNGYFIEGSGLTIFGNAHSHYLTSFFLTDATPTFNDKGETVTMPDGRIALVTGLVSAGGHAFQAGTFEYADLQEDLKQNNQTLLKSKYENKSFFFSPVLKIDTDGDHDWKEEADVKITGGTIKITGTLPNLTLEYNLNTVHGKTVKGKYSGKMNKIYIKAEDPAEVNAKYGPHPGGAALPNEVKGSWSTTTISLANAWNGGQFVKAVGVSGAITLVFLDDNKVERYWYTETRPHQMYSIYGSSKETGRVKVEPDGSLTLIWAAGEWRKITAPSENSTDGHFTYSATELASRQKKYLGFSVGTSGRNLPELRLTNENGNISYFEKL